MKFKTLDEHRTYLHEIVKLKLFFIHLWLEKHPEESFAYVIRERVDIYRKTAANPGRLNPEQTYFDQDPWLAMERETEQLYKKYRNDRAAFERHAFEVFRDSINARAERDYADSSVLSRYQCGSLKHDEETAPDGTIQFHIANAVQPESIFSVPGHLESCFRRLLDIVEKIYGAKEIATHTWLNSCPKWLALFPQEWQDNLSAPKEDSRWWYSFWGQYITSRGTFNFKYGNILRETGQHPFLPRGSHCSIAAMRKKLDETAEK